MQANNFNKVFLDQKNAIHIGSLPETLLPDEAQFEAIWNLHPTYFHEIKFFNKLVKTPRWQQAYNKSYQYTGSINTALPIPEILNCYWQWLIQEIEPGLNALLLNWYDGKLGHYIGKHRDSTINMIPGKPIVSVSFGESRKLRLRPYQSDGYKDFIIDNGSVYIIPYNTNQSWTHEIPKSKKHSGRRVSLTFRVFE